MVKCVHWKVSVGLKYAQVSRIDSFLNLSSSYTCIQERFCICTFSRESNFLMGGLLFDSSINLFISSRSVYVPWRKDVIDISFASE